MSAEIKFYRDVLGRRAEGHDDLCADELRLTPADLPDQNTDGEEPCADLTCPHAMHCDCLDESRCPFMGLLGDG